MPVIFRLEKNFKLKLSVAIFVFLLSTVKFLFAPVSGIKTLTYWETIAITIAGGWTGVATFYFSSSYFFRRAEFKRKRKELLLRAKGNYRPHKKFTRLNKFIVRAKKRFGLIGISFVTPAIISIPIGSALLAKFYPNWKITIPVVFAFLAGWSFFLTTFGTKIFEMLGWI